MRQSKLPAHVDAVTGDILDACIEVHRTAGRGLLESFYEAMLEDAIRRRGHAVRRQVSMPGNIGNVSVDVAYRIDMIVDETVLVEVKAVSELAPVHFAQTRTYLQLSGFPVALLVNFNAARIADGFARLESRPTAAPTAPPSPTPPAETSQPTTDELSKG